MKLLVGESLGKKELVLKTIGRPIKAGATITLEEEDIRKPDISLAIKQGYLIKLIEETENDKKIAVTAALEKTIIEEKPKTRKLVKKKKKRTTKKITKKKPNQRPEEPQTKMSSWDPHSEEMINKEESNLRVAGIPKKAKAKSSMHTWDPTKETLVDEEESAKQATDQKENEDRNVKKDLAIQTGEIDFSDNKKISKKISKRKSIKISSRKTKKKSGKSLKPVGRHRKEPTAGNDMGGLDPDALPNESGGIGFVDIEQDNERITSRMRAQQNEEIE